LSSYNALLLMHLKNLKENGCIKNTAVDLNAEFDYNCWGFVAYLNGWEECAEWLWVQDILALLESNTVKLRGTAPALPGDILVYYGIPDYGGSEEITHTAVYLGDGKIIHKPGALPVEVMDMQDVAEEYEMYGHIKEVRRPHHET
jgi:hypothetical protein